MATGGSPSTDAGIQRVLTEAVVGGQAARLAHRAPRWERWAATCFPSPTDTCACTETVSSRKRVLPNDCGVGERLETARPCYALLALPIERRFGGLSKRTQR